MDVGVLRQLTMERMEPVKKSEGSTMPAFCRVFLMYSSTAPTTMTAINAPTAPTMSPTTLAQPKKTPPASPSRRHAGRHTGPDEAKAT